MHQLDNRNRIKLIQVSQNCGWNVLDDNTLAFLYALMYKQ